MTRGCLCLLFKFVLQKYPRQFLVNFVGFLPFAYLNVAAWQALFVVN
jgi:hypothetical protein